ncbi:MAG: TPM domain-containing protein [Bacteroidota bacterium]
MKGFKNNFLLAVFLSAISFLLSCQTASENKTVTGDSANSKNIFSASNSEMLSKPDNWVNDNENILNDSSIAQLTKLITDWRDRTAVEIGVVTTASYAPYDSITAYSIALGNQWGIGQKEINNGILIVVSTTQREVRISTGLGMEQLLTDDMCHQVVYDKILPSFKKGNYPEGIINGVKEIIRLLEAQMHQVKM